MPLLLKQKEIKNIKIPENTRVIIEDGVIIFEGKEKAPKKHELNKWYHSDTWIGLTIQSDDEYDNSFYCNGFEKFGDEWKWFENMCCVLDGCKPADMKEVERLLVGEAEKRGYKEGVKVKDEDGCMHAILDEGVIVNSCLIVMSLGSSVCVFNTTTGKWAEIIKPKPLYVNAYGTKFFEGDDAYWVVMRTGEICHDYISEVNFYGTSIGYTSEIMTEQECHLYIYENWDKLKK